MIQAVGPGILEGFLIASRGRRIGAPTVTDAHCNFQHTRINYFFKPKIGMTLCSSSGPG
jgi:hypothetical protein